jgi:hemoglobin-like flavoprotein
VTPEQVALVQTSFAELKQDAPAVAERFYARLFELAPSVKAMFSTDTNDQASLFVTELGMIVLSIAQYDEFVPRARALGARHVGFGVTYAHYDIARGALLDAFAEALGPRYTADVSEAWRLAWDLVAETMMQGAAEVWP